MTKISTPGLQGQSETAPEDAYDRGRHHGISPERSI